MTFSVRGLAASSLLFLLLAVALSADDWPQVLGPTRNGIYRGIPLAKSWPAAGPRLVWKKPVGAGLAGVAVAQGRVILFHRVANEEVVESLDARTGASQWRYAYPTTYRDDFGFDEGPRAVPVVADGRVFTFGAEGQLSALTLAEGKALWRVNVMQRFGVNKGYFGAAGSPLVEDDRVIANVGGKGKNAGIVAFKADTGEVLWTATNHEASYSSPTSALLGGKRTAVFLTREGLVGLDPATGTMRFQQRWRARYAASVNAATPLIIDDLVFISASYDTGATVVRVKDTSLSPLWASDDALSNHYATSVHAEGHVYGFHGRQEYGQSLRCIDLKTGAVRWEVDGFGAGTITLAGDRLLVVTEGGDLVIAAASPKAFTPLARKPVLPPTVRAYPALADGIMYIRNETTLVALDLR